MIHRIKVSDKRGGFVLTLHPRKGKTIPNKSAQLIVHTLMRLNVFKAIYPVQVDLAAAIKSKPPAVRVMEEYLKKNGIIFGKIRSGYKLVEYLTCLNKEVAKFLLAVRKCIDVSNIEHMDPFLCQDLSPSALMSLIKTINKKAWCSYTMDEVHELLLIFKKSGYLLQEKGIGIILNLDRWLVTKLIISWAYRFGCPSLSIYPKYVYKKT